MIKKSILSDGNLFPSIINITNSIPDSILTNNEHRLRHPNIIAYRSLTRVFNAFDEIRKEVFIVHEYFEKYNKLTDKNEKEITNKLSGFIIELLEAMNSHIEDCFHIFKCITPFLNIKKKFTLQWLEKANHPTYLQFSDSVKLYREQISQYVNNYKHEHGKIDIIVGRHDKGNILGYVMKFIDETPNDDVKEVLDFNSLKNITEDLKYHLFWLYKISDDFSKAFKDSVKFYYSTEFKLISSQTLFDNFDEIIQFININDIITFPGNYVFNPQVYIEYDSSELIIDYPIGITSENENMIAFKKVKGKEYPQNSVFIVPTQKTVEYILSNIGKKVTLTDEHDNFTLIYMTCCFKEDKVSITELELNYNNKFKIKSFSDMAILLSVKGGIDSEMYLKVFKTDYLSKLFPKLKL